MAESGAHSVVLSCGTTQLSEEAVGITIDEQSNGKIVLKVKTLSEKPLRVEIAPSASVGELKELVKKQANAEGKFLRLIHQGKMLSDDKATLASCRVQSEDFIHCAISTAPPKAVVNQMAATDSDPEERDDPATRRGFDRLRDRLSREEIQALRLYFYPQLSVFISQAERVAGESSEDRIYRLEEEWMDSQGPQSEFALNVVPTARIALDHQIDMNGMNNSILAADNEGTGTEFLWGFLMGLLLGVFMLLMVSLVRAAFPSLRRATLDFEPKRGESKPTSIDRPEAASLWATFMLSALDEEEQKIAAALEAPNTALPSDGDAADSNLPKKRKRHSSVGSTESSTPNSMGKELTVDQKAIVKTHVTRGTTEGIVKCCFCDKEISSRNVDRWASHLRGCIKTPEDVKAQIQPFRGATPPAAAPSPVSTHLRRAPPMPKAVVPTTTAPVTTTTMTPAPATSQLSNMVNPMGTGYNEVFKVHVSKDYMKFNAAHFIAYKVCLDSSYVCRKLSWSVTNKLHGHNYRVAVTITGTVGPDGYVVDFGEIKKISRVICKDLNESFLVPMNSDSLKVRGAQGNGGSLIASPRLEKP
ncbi:hypothetical protein BBJ28_00019294 [Nothophytophthora sp. Chile5]|nr:hypothetical protein BBJ28_00019294 [Nothophytophthora sp. Chile5]